MSLDKYNHKKIENKIYSYWEKNKFLNLKKTRKIFFYSLYLRQM